MVSLWCGVVMCGVVWFGLWAGMDGRRVLLCAGQMGGLTGVPARVDDSDAEAAAVVFLGFAGSFEGGVHFWGWDAWFG